MSLMRFGQFKQVFIVPNGRLQHFLKNYGHMNHEQGLSFFAPLCVW
jgi:hypothetical protein